ncbi:MAG: copper resistance protein NlpE N-terminal domain-containing protein [Actinobacteria bacterium]|nr:copper resistance protein NlpE N-terminal domain-containing protein [Actinomycetota bacterium]
MNNKVKSEKFRILPITSLVTGILGFGIAYLLLFFVFHYYGFGFGFENFIPEEFIMIFYLSFMVISLPITAIVCGSIDLKRIKAGLFRSKVFKGMDIAGIVLGSVFILMAATFFITMLPGSPSADIVVGAGTYEGVLPCADCEGIETVLTLNFDSTFTMESTYLGKSDEPFITSGEWSIDVTQKITLAPSDSPDEPIYYIIVSDNEIKMLDRMGNEIESQLNYSLLKQ